MKRALVGRELEQTRIASALAAGERVLVLVGPPGVGKTALARAAVGAALFVSVDIERRDELVAAVARAASIRASAEDPSVLLARIASALDAASAIVVVDGAERARSVVKDLILDLRDVTTSARFVITTRERLDLPDELVVSVKPLAHDDAAELLTVEIGRRSAETRIDAQTAARIAARVDGLPLAIELVAARIATLGVAHALEEGAPAELDRVLDGSWRHLDERARTALAELSVFRGGFDLAAARAVLGADAAEVVARLTAASLVTRSEVDQRARFDVLAIVRAYVERRQLATDAAERHAAHFASIGAARADDAQSWARLARERENLLAAFRASAPDPVRAAKLAAVLDPILVTAGPAALHEEVLVTALAGLDQAAAPREATDVLLALGRHHGLRGRHLSAVSCFERALVRAREAEDEIRTGWAEAFLAFSLRPLARFEEANARGRAALERAWSLREPRLEVMTEQTLGLVALDREDLATASEHFRRALATARTCDAPRLEAIVLANLALAAFVAGELASASAHAASARAIFERVGDRFHFVRVGHVEALLASARGEHADAERQLHELLDAAIEHGDLDGEIAMRSGLARVAAARGDSRLALLRFDEARAIARRTDDEVEKARLEREARRLESPRTRSVLVVTRDGRSLTLDGRTIDLSRRGPARRLVVALAEHRLGLLHRDRKGLDVDAMLAAGWPGERMRAESGAARVYMAVRRLRELGLESVLRTDDGGYSFDCNVRIGALERER